jgi:pilus assembly protein Flp/PilA
MLSTLLSTLHQALTRDDEGQGMIEYGLLVALISIAAIVVIVLIGPQIGNLFQTVMNAM